MRYQKKARSGSKERALGGVLEGLGVGLGGGLGWDSGKELEYGFVVGNKYGALRALQEGGWDRARGTGLGWDTGKGLCTGQG
ncbi:hypothetical protein PoB_005748500 [Plakobranchus ocellatus]|uniref:Uncharacterized protein n=1 Tax=Plakobranchus ocellatus TaxID=259542 RepID=A0AAV4CGT1_9GAST|nr:hypothetical protein PoB_005748500 [Plakobranchus ocellatus]